MRIKELAARTGLSRDTIRYYEKLGLLAPEREAGGNGYKNYGQRDVDALYVVSQAKRLGMTLTTIRAHLGRFLGGAMSPEELTALFESQLTVVAARRAELEAYEGYLREKIARMASGEVFRVGAEALSGSPVTDDGRSATLPGKHPPP